MKPQFNAIGIVVKEMDQAVGFYAQLGLEFKRDSSGHAECELPGGLRLMLDTEELMRSISSDWVPATGAPRVSFAFQLDSPAEVDTLYTTLMELGHHGARAPWDAFWGQRYATIHDPDGNGIDLYAAL